MRFGPTAPYADLITADTPTSRRPAHALNQAAHLLTPTQPPAALIDILHSRIGHIPGWDQQVTALVHWYPPPRLLNTAPPPDRPHRALLRGADRPSYAGARGGDSPDGTWLATSSDDRTVRISSKPDLYLRMSMHVDASLSSCEWDRDSMDLICFGRAGPYRFRLQPSIQSDHRHEGG
jgi:hypothetical protein